VDTFEIILALVTMAVIVATLARRLRAPAPSLLVLAGVLVGLLPGVASVQIPPDVVGLLVLPPLLFAAATDVAVSELRGVLRPVLGLAVGLVAFTAVAVAGTLHWVDPQVTLEVAFVLGAVLASTDPVAVSALARRLRLPPRLLALVQGESLLNDATSLVLFQVAVGVVVAGTGVSLLKAGGQFLLLGAGGAAIGLAAAFLADRLRRRTEDAVLATVLALLTPYLVFAVAEVLHTSGVTAVVIAGLRLSRSRDHVTPGPIRLQIAHVYAVVVFLLESAVFAVIGLELPALVSRLSDADRDFAPIALAVTAAVVLSRAIWIYPTGYLQRLRTDRGGSEPPPWRALAVLSWAGTRGVVPLAAALAIPLTTVDGQPFPERELLLVLAASCIALTLVVQGLTLEPLVRRLSITQDPAALERELALGRAATAAAALARLDELDEDSDEPAGVLSRLRRDVEARAAITRKRLAEGPSSEHTGGGQASTGLAYRRLRTDLLEAERARLNRLRDEGRIGEETRRALERAIDLEEARLADTPDPL
jgi:monovalent cation/hydrogen antiporter